MEKVKAVSPIFLLERETVIALEDKVIVEYASPLKEYRAEYKYSELKPRVIRGKSGDPSWTSLGNFFLGAAFFIAISSVFVFRGLIDSPYYRFIIISLVAIGVIAHCFRLIKYNKVWIDEKDGSSGVFIKLTKENRDDAEKVISYISERMNQEKSVPALKVE